MVLISLKYDSSLISLIKLISAYKNPFWTLSITNFCLLCSIVTCLHCKGFKDIAMTD